MKKIISLVLIGCILSGCAVIRPHKKNIEQGNVITPEQVSELHKGMTESQVIEVMGNPLLTNVFSTNRLDYVYTYQPGYGDRTEKRITCIFSHGRLKEIIR